MTAPPITASLARGCRHHQEATEPGKASGRQAVRNDLTEGTGRGTYGVLARLTSRERGIAYGPRGLRRRSPHSSPRSGKPATWRRGTGVGIPDQGGPRDAYRRNWGGINRAGGSRHWRAGSIER